MEDTAKKEKFLFKPIKTRSASTAAQPPHKSGRGEVPTGVCTALASFTMYKGMERPRERVKVRD
jgi:hypothetical protein